MKKVAIVGYGWVGKAMYDLFPNASVYDPYLANTEDTKNVFVSKSEVNECDIAFICVPTPNQDERSVAGENAVINGEGQLDTSIVEEVIEWCKCPTIVIRSTINPGDCDMWENRYEKKLVFQPEYLGETPAHPLLDTTTRPFLIVGGNEVERRKVIELYQTVYNANTKIRQVTNYQAEIIKLSENRAIAFKVAQCQELFDVCEKAGEDYYTIQQAVYGDDPRFNLWWTFIYPEARGMNSKCIPKDVYAWCAWAESLGYEPGITRALLERNKKWIK